MATPTTHIILSESMYDKHFSHCSEKDFIIGTLLPDIRYLDHSIPRESLHFRDVSLEVIFSLTNCFEQWLYFHSLVDRKRNNFYINKGIYIPWENEDFILALKLLEDELLYDKVKDWQKIISYMETFPYENIKDIKQEVLQKRYNLIKTLISQQPSPSARRQFMQGLGLDEDYIQRINWIVAEIKKENKYKKIIDELYDTFDDVIQDK
jgi:hypothetical protein